MYILLTTFRSMLPELCKQNGIAYYVPCSACCIKLGHH
jgi:hypothetical protein